MNKINALVSGIGTIIGYGIINSLKQCKYDVHIIGMDMNPEAVGKHWSDDFVVAVPAASEDFIPFLKKIIDDYKIDIVFLGIEQEMNKITACRDELGEYLNKIIINSESVIDLTNDKWSTYEFLKRNRLPVIESTLERDYEKLRVFFGGDFLVKPRRSYSSRGVKKIQDETTFNYYKFFLGDQFMAQRVVGDDEHEYTAAAFCYGNGKGSKPIILKRKLSFEGSTIKAEVVDCKPIEDSIVTLTGLLKPLGPTNFQYRVENNIAFLLEINPRVSSSTSLRSAFGYNEAEMAIDFFVEKHTEVNPIVKRGKAVRYISDYVELV